MSRKNLEVFWFVVFCLTVVFVAAFVYGVASGYLHPMTYAPRL
jgi:hypothetical protein